MIYIVIMVQIMPVGYTSMFCFLAKTTLIIPNQNARNSKIISSLE